MAMPDMRAVILITRRPAPELPRAHNLAPTMATATATAPVTTPTATAPSPTKKQCPGQECRGQIAGNANYGEAPYSPPVGLKQEKQDAGHDQRNAGGYAGSNHRRLIPIPSD